MAWMMCWALGVGRGLEMLSVTNQEDIMPVPAVNQQRPRNPEIGKEGVETNEPMMPHRSVGSSVAVMSVDLFCYFGFFCKLGPAIELGRVLRDECVSSSVTVAMPSLLLGRPLRRRGFEGRRVMFVIHSGLLPCLIPGYHS
jgi:hypothetical protein